MLDENFLQESRISVTIIIRVYIFIVVLYLLLENPVKYFDMLNLTSSTVANAIAIANPYKTVLLKFSLLYISVTEYIIMYNIVINIRMCSTIRNAGKCIRFVKLHITANVKNRQ